jgi:predicted glycogen debranching enzyme
MPKATWATRPQSYNEGVKHEWLVANGLGGYASSTTICANTRAYHGMLVAAMHPPTDRMLLLSSLDEELILDGEERYMLSNHQYTGAIYPQGFRFLWEFRLDPFPHFFYKVGDTRVDKTVFIVHGENTTLVHYVVSGAGGLMRIVPLTTCRNFHAASELSIMRQEEVEGGTRLISNCDLFLLSDKARYMRQELVYYNFEYEEERLRGLPWRENCFSPGHFEINLKDETSFCIMASAERRSAPVVQEIIKNEIDRLDKLEKKLEQPLRRFVQAADSFVVERGEGKSIIAGYHWFYDWGRDAMISLPGLLLVTGRFEDAKKVLKTYASSMKDGVLPNDLSSWSTNSVDSSLFFIQAVFKYFNYTGDRELIRQLWPYLLGIVERYSGVSPAMKMDSDSLIIAGPALTWMDSRVDGWPITPRAGKACEINALWYSTLRIMEKLAKALDQPWDCELAEKVKKSYGKFWNSENGCLFDLIGPEDASIRPNQILAATIPDLLPLIKRKRIVEIVTQELLTPYGLRTLSPSDPRYIGKYEGNWNERAQAYHQGTVWPWLIGPYITAFLLANEYSTEGRDRAAEILHPLMERLDLPGINTIPEIFDGNEPYWPRGCISQAWSVAELMRAWHEDVMLRRKRI